MFNDKIIPAIVSSPEYLRSLASKFRKSEFVNKITTSAASAGRAVVRVALTLYYGLGRAPLKDKILIMGALAYFCLPLDFIPDFVPVIGYSDDLTALMSVYRIVRRNLPESVRRKARMRTAQLIRTC